MKEAILVVDMLNEFVTGSISNERALATIAPNAKLLDAARKAGIPVIFCNDSHVKGVDAEFKLWGEHAVSGTKGAQVIDELKVGPSDYIVEKRRYSAFFQTNLDMLLRELGVDTLIITGLWIHLCVRQTTVDGFCHGYKIVMPKDATNAFTQDEYDYSIDFLKGACGAEITDVDTLVAKWSK